MLRTNQIHSAPAPHDLDYRSLFRGIPGNYLVLSPDFVILEASDHRLHATMTQREDILGRPLFEVFPDNPDDPEASGVRNLRDSLERVLREGVPDVMAVQKYDIRRSPEEGGEFEERFWSPVNAPVIGPDGDVRFIIHRVEDVTEFIRALHAGSPAEGFDAMAADVYRRARELQESNRQLLAANAALAEARDQATAVERRATEILESITDAFFAVDREWRFTYVNPEAARVLQRRRDELLGAGIWEAFPEAVGTIFFEQYHRAAEERVAVAFEAFYPPLDAWFDVRAYPSGEGVSVYFLDVTDRKQTELEASLLHALTLRIGEADSLDSAMLAMLRELCQATGHGYGEIWIPDEQGDRLVRASVLSSGGAGEACGIATMTMRCGRGEGLVGRAWAQKQVVWSSNLAAAVEVPYDGAAAGPGRGSGVSVPIAAGDEIVAVMMLMDSRSRTADPSLVRLLTNVSIRLGTLIQHKRDATAIRELNWELKERNRLVTMAGRVARLGGWVVDLSEGIVHWSDEVCAIHEVPPGTRVRVHEGIGFYAPEWQPVIREHFSACAEDGIAYDLELEILTRRGRRVWVRTIGEAVREPDGAITRVQGAFQDITDRKAAEDSLRRSEARFAGIVSIASDAIISMDEGGRIVLFNRGAEEIFGYLASEVIGRPIGLLIPRHFERGHPFHEEQFCESVSMARRIGHRQEIFALRKNGDEFPAEASISELDLEGDRLMTVVLRDVSERKRAEAALRASEETLRQIAENIREIFWMFDPDFSKTIYVSPAYTEIWGRAVEELYKDPRNFVSAVHPDDREVVVAAMLAVKTGMLDDVEYRVIRPDGQVRWVRSRGYPVYNEHGEVYRAVGTTEDITDRKSAEEDREAAQADYRHLFDTAPYGIYALDSAGRFTKLNPAAERLLDCPAAAVIGQHFSTVVVPADLEVAQDGFDRVISGEANDIEFDERIRRASGEERLIRVTESAILAGGEIVGTHGIARDITDEVERQKSLRRVERLASVGTLLGGVAHELNNPLHAIGNFAELMLMEERDAQDQEALEIIRREADRAARVVSDLRLIARETQDEHNSREPVDLNDVIQHVMKVRQYSLATGNVAVRLDLAQDLPQVQGNRGQIEQVLLNLVVNAEQAMAEQPVPRHLILRTRSTSDGVALHVVDTGPGIAKEVLERIFDPFFTTKAPGEGTGLGLSLVHSIVAEHGGKIHVESEVGSGTAFRIELPRATLVVGGIGRDPGAPGSTSTWRILVVDDEPAIRRVVSRFLTRKGHEVVEADEGADALRLLAEEHFDVILSDLRMPGLGGEELLSRLRVQGAGLERRLIFVTGDVTRTRGALCADGVEIPLLVKPVSLDILERAIEAVASSRSDDLD